MVENNIFALDIAKYIVTQCFRAGNAITNIPLQNLLYLIQRDYLRATDKYLFPDCFEAWHTGPVVPMVHYFFCRFGAMKINTEYKTPVDKLDTGLIDREILVWEQEGLHDPWCLVDKVQKIGGAWDTAYAKGNGMRREISFDAIKADI